MEDGNETFVFLRVLCGYWALQKEKRSVPVALL